jgi:hypothetical protein
MIRAVNVQNACYFVDICINRALRCVYASAVSIRSLQDAISAYESSP